MNICTYRNSGMFDIPIQEPVKSTQLWKYTKVQNPQI